MEIDNLHDCINFFTIQNMLSNFTDKFGDMIGINKVKNYHRKSGRERIDRLYPKKLKIIQLNILRIFRNKVSIKSCLKF